MAYDKQLAERTRAVLADMGLPFEEKKMFGGLAFLVNGHMAVAASGHGGLLVRADPAEGERLIRAGKAEPMEMRGRPLSGWLRVGAVDPAGADPAGRKPAGAGPAGRKPAGAGPAGRGPADAGPAARTDDILAGDGLAGWVEMGVACATALPAPA
jgi:hypothetical protein